MSVGKKPRKPLPRYSRLKSTRLRPKKRSPKERETKLAREYGGDERRDWISRQWCLACRRTPCVNAHTKHPSSGMAYKGDAEAVVPLCLPHEKEKHAHGEETFNAKYADMLLGRTLAEWAAIFAQAWDNRRGLVPIGAILPGVMRQIERGRE